MKRPLHKSMFFNSTYFINFTKNYQKIQRVNNLEKVSLVQIIRKVKLIRMMILTGKMINKCKFPSLHN